ncbi:hypothetical protein DPX16_20163 [Anabarilius grahami]|uniref:Uncharacterized protein n=1 Tax=Anabarilius grahami TaxID=495550 RepID=A0A3N0XQV2_ANAGA|nr:hypothetical protein DPX16_20163 [Anabarilius grahami]
MYPDLTYHKLCKFSHKTRQRKALPANIATHLLAVPTKEAEDARRNQAQTRHHLDQRLIETQNQRGTADESKPELQEELQRLQKALADLHLGLERRELFEKESREELTGKLQQGEALLAKAETELKERHVKARACENHLKQARKEVIALKPQRDYLKDGLDAGYRELKSGMGGETHVTEFPLTSQESLVPKGVKSPLPKMSNCPAEAKPRTPVIGTQAEIVADRLLVHTPTCTATLTYNQHDTATRVSLPNQSMWIQVPQGAIIQLDNLALYYLSSEAHRSELEIPSSSRNHNLTLEPELELRIEKGRSQLIDITPVDTALQALSRLPVLTSSPIAQAWTAADTALCLSMAIGCALTWPPSYQKGSKGCKSPWTSA